MIFVLKFYIREESLLFLSYFYNQKVELPHQESL